MTTTDALIIVAIILGPIAAVGGVRWLDRGRDRRDRRIEVFRILMATRTHTTSREHLQALNRIDVEFSASNPADKAVLDAWKRHARDSLRSDLPADQWDVRHRAGLADLLLCMAEALGYELDREHIETSAAARAPAAASLKEL